MFEFLVHKCIKDADEIERPEVRKRYGFFSSIVGIICNVILFASKLAIGLIAGSISIVSDGVNNLSDCATCIVTMFGYKMAAKPADRDHPFGHGRMEYLTSLVIAAAIVAVGFELLRSSVEKVMHPERVTFSFLALLVLVLSMLVKIGMGVMNRKLGTKLSSTCDVGIFRSADGWNHGNRGVSHDYAFRLWYCERYGRSAAWTAGR